MGEKETVVLKAFWDLGSQLLLYEGYKVHGTIRDPCDIKNAHLKNLEKADENLQLFKVDLFDFEGLSAVVAGWTGVFHAAWPMPHREKAPNNSETSMRNYYLSKIMAENEVLEYAKGSELRVITVCLFIILGLMLQPTVNGSSLVLLTILKDGLESVENHTRPIVDVPDIAEALILAYKEPEAERRYICTSHVIKVQALVEMLKGVYPNFNNPERFIEVVEEMEMSLEKLHKFGWKYWPLEKTIVDFVNNSFGSSTDSLSMTIFCTGSVNFIFLADLSTYLIIFFGAASVIVSLPPPSSFDLF